SLVPAILRPSPQGACSTAAQWTTLRAAVVRPVWIGSFRRPGMLREPISRNGDLVRCKKPTPAFLDDEMLHSQVKSAPLPHLCKSILDRRWTKQCNRSL